MFYQRRRFVPKPLRSRDVAMIPTTVLEFFRALKIERVKDFYRSSGVLRRYAPELLVLIFFALFDPVPNYIAIKYFEYKKKIVAPQSKNRLFVCFEEGGEGGVL